MLEQVVKHLEEGGEPPPETAPERPGTREERRAALRSRIRSGNRRRTVTILLGLAALVAVIVIRLALRN